MNYTKKTNVFSKSTLSILMMGLLVFPFSNIEAAVVSQNGFMSTGSGANTTNQYAFTAQNAKGVFESVVGCTITTNSISNLISKVLVKGQKFGAQTNSRYQEIFLSREDTVGAGEGTEVNLKSTAEQDFTKRYGWDASSQQEDNAVNEFNKFVTETGVAPGQPVMDIGVQSNTQKSIDEQKEINESTKKTLAEIEEAKIREQCLNGVAYTLAKKQLAKITNDTLSWVNTGLGGDPFFVRDQVSYLENIADQELIKFLNPISSSTNSTLYPYGRTFARGQFLDRSTSFEQRSISTMSRNLPANTTTDDWSNDFSRGGWPAWFAFTQNPANNPLGYQIIATEEAAKRQNAAQQAAQKEIDQGNGFLSDKKCVESVGKNNSNITFTDSNGNTIEMSYYEFLKLEEEIAVIPDKQIFTVTGENGEQTEISKAEIQKIRNNINTSGNIDGYSTTNGTMSTNSILPDGSRCLRWEVVTPGSVISNQVNEALTSSIRQLELADSINESLSGIFEGLLTNLMSKGLKNLDQTTNGTSSTSNGNYNFSNFYDSLGNNLSILPGYNSNRDVLIVNQGSGFNTNDFDITIDLGDITGTIYYEGCKKTIVNKKDSIPCVSIKDKNLVNPIVLNECSDGIDNDGDGQTDSNDSTCKTGQNGVVKKGLITLQKDYIEAVKRAKVELPNVMPALGELDYCIPGPNPAWRNTAIESVNANIEFVRSLSIDKDQNITSIYGKMADLDKRFYENKEGNGWATAGQIVPAVGSAFGPVGTGISTVVGALFNLKAQDVKNRVAENYYNEKTLLERYQINNIEEFEKDKVNGITKLIKTFNAYESDYESLYGQNSPMRTPPSLFEKNDFYLPMANTGLELTQNMRVYAKNIEKATSDYDDLVTEANANIYKLEEIKKKVDTIVRRAKARRANDILRGRIKVDPACYGLIDLGITDAIDKEEGNGSSGIGGGVVGAGGTGTGGTTGGGTQTTGNKTGSQ